MTPPAHMGPPAPSQLKPRLDRCPQCRKTAQLVDSRPTGGLGSAVYETGPVLLRLLKHLVPDLSAVPRTVEHAEGEALERAPLRRRRFGCECGYRWNTVELRPEDLVALVEAAIERWNTSDDTSEDDPLRDAPRHVR